jgi:hypothetical protein
MILLPPSFKSEVNWVVMLVVSVVIMEAEKGGCQQGEFVSIKDTSGYPGDTIPVAIYIDAPIPAIDFYIEGSVHHSTELISFSLDNTVLDTTIWNYLIELDGNRFQGAFYPDSLSGSVPGSGVLLELDLYVPTGAGVETSSVFIYQALITDTLGMGYFDTAYADFLIDELPWARGDINHDGAINLDDLHLLLSYVYEGTPIPGPIGTGDVTADNYIDIVDFFELKRILYGYAK